jgi:hypothetical protein
MSIYNGDGDGKAEKDRKSDSALHRGVEGAVKAHEGVGRRVLGERWDGRDTLTIEEAGVEILRLSRAAAYAAAQSGELPTVLIGRRLLVPRVALERMLAGE